MKIRVKITGYLEESNEHVVEFLDEPPYEHGNKIDFNVGCALENDHDDPEQVILSSKAVIGNIYELDTDCFSVRHQMFLPQAYHIKLLPPENTGA